MILKRRYSISMYTPYTPYGLSYSRSTFGKYCGPEEISYTNGDHVSYSGDELWNFSNIWEVVEVIVLLEKRIILEVCVGAEPMAGLE